MYSIYHIPGVKIGCTDDLNRRLEQQGYTNAEVLEEHTDIFTASNREIKLQKQYGYKVDVIPYFKSVENWGSKAGKIGGKHAQKTLKKNKLGIYTDDIELRREWQKKGSDVVKQKYGKEHYRKMAFNSHKNGNKGAEASCKKVMGIDKNNNTLYFDSIILASKHLNVSHAAISNNLRGVVKTTKGYRFQYV